MFQSATFLSEHMKTHQGEEQAKVNAKKSKDNIVCQKCNVCFRSEDEKKNHEYMHLEVNPQTKCDQCDFNFIASY